jgi:hypothetical protein
MNDITPNERQAAKDRLNDHARVVNHARVDVKANAAAFAKAANHAYVKASDVYSKAYAYYKADALDETIYAECKNAAVDKAVADKYADAAAKRLEVSVERLIAVEKEAHELRQLYFSL